MSFFKQFPNTLYQFQANQPSLIKDFFRHVDANRKLSKNITAYTKYEILDGERPDNVSQKLYGTPDFYWTFFIINENLKNGIDDWPKASSTIESEFQLEYDPLASMIVVPKVDTGAEKYTEEVAGDSEQKIDLGTTKFITNSFNGIDLDYADLRVTRNYETAKIVSWDSDTLTLTLSDFSNRSKFLEDDSQAWQMIILLVQMLLGV